MAADQAGEVEDPVDAKGIGVGAAPVGGELGLDDLGKRVEPGAVGGQRERQLPGTEGVPPASVRTAILSRSR